MQIYFETKLLFSLLFTSLPYWRCPGVLQAQSGCNTVKILTLNLLGPELHPLVIVCLVMLNTSFITIWNTTQTKPRRSPNINQSNGSTEKLFYMLTSYLAPGTTQCTQKCLLLRVLHFNEASSFVPGQHNVSGIECPSLGLVGVRAKPLGDHLIWRTTLVLHCILGLHVYNSYVLSLLTPSSALRVGPWAQYSPPWYGRLLSHPRFQRPFVQWPGSTVWQLCLPKTEYCY